LPNAPYLTLSDNAQKKGVKFNLNACFFHYLLFNGSDD